MKANGARESFAETEERWPPIIRSCSFTLGTGGSRPNSAGKLLQEQRSPSKPGLGADRPSTTPWPGHGATWSAGGDRPCSVPTGTLCSTGGMQRNFKSGRPTLGRLGSERVLSKPGLLSPEASRRRAQGLSPKAHLQNARAGRNLLALSMHRSQSDTQMIRMDEHQVLDEEGFIEQLVSCDRSIADIQRDINNFDPNTTGRTPKGQQSPAQSKRRGGEKSEAEEDRERRFEQYKMVRKIEPEEIPPLDRRCLTEPLEMAKESPLVKQNASRKAMEQHLPHAKQQRQQTLKTQRSNRGLSTTVMRTQLVSDCCSQWTKVLDRKHAQGSDALEKQRCGQAQKAPDRGELQKEWLIHIASGCFLVQAQKCIAVAKMTPEERAKHQIAAGRKPSKCTAENAEEAPDVDSVLIRWGPRLRAKLQMLRRRKSARVMWHSMSQWQVGGTALMLLKIFALRCVKLQRWWRECLARIQEQRQVVSKRWRQLEKEDLQHNPSLGGQSFKIQEETMSDAVRNEFVKNELRARRYLVLSQIELWEKDISRWRMRLQDWAETRRAQRALGVFDEEAATTQSRNMRAFMFPQTRPSHLPPRHPNHQNFTMCCPEDCPGRRGDAEITGMIHRCREFREGGGGWKTISIRDSKGNKGGGSKRGKAGGAPAKKAADSPLQATVSETDLRRHGVHLQSLPGLAGVSEREESQ